MYVQSVEGLTNYINARYCLSINAIFRVPLLFSLKLFSQESSYSGNNISDFQKFLKVFLKFCQKPY